MLSKKQRIEIDKRISLVVKTFLENNNSIDDVAQKLGISSSTVQRDLSSERIIVLFGENVYWKVKKQKARKKAEGLSKGGNLSQARNELLRDENGKFQGVRRK